MHRAVGDPGVGEVCRYRIIGQSASPARRCLPPNAVVAWSRAQNSWYDQFLQRVHGSRHRLSSTATMLYKRSNQCTRFVDSEEARNMRGVRRGTRTSRDGQGALTGSNIPHREEGGA